MKNIFYAGDFEALLDKTDLKIPSKIEDVDLSVIVYFRQFHKDWLTFVLQLLSLSDINFEILLVNDGSKINIGLPQNDRLGIISNSETRGEAVCLKQALDVVKGKYIKFLAYPEMVAPNGLLAQLKALQENPKEICFGDVILTIGDENKELSAKSCDDLESLINSDISNVLIYKSAVFQKKLLDLMVSWSHITDDMYDDITTSIAGFSYRMPWMTYQVMFIEDTVTALLNESPTLFDFMNMRRASIYSKGRTLAEYTCLNCEDLAYGNNSIDIKIAILDNNLNTGGAQWSILQWVKLLPENFKVKFLLYTEGAMVAKARNENIDIEIWDQKTSFEDWLCSRIKDWEADIVDVVWNGDLLTEKVAHASPCVIAHLQTYDIPWLDNLMAKKQNSRIDKFIAVSESIKEKYSRLSDKISVINSPVNVNKYLDLSSKRKTIRKMLNINTDDFVVGWCGRILSPEKRADLLREVIEGTENKNIKFVISGIIDGNMRDRDMYILGWQKWCEDHNVSLILDLKPWEMDIFHSVSDIFISLSDTEGLSLATLEAMVSGSPVVSTDVGGQSEAVIPKITGMLIEKDSAKQAINAIAALYQSYKDNNTLDLMKYLGQSLISSECNLENIARQHAIMYTNQKKNGHQ